MYDPIKDGVEKSVKNVTYIEVAPPSHLSDLVHNFWQIKSDQKLDQDFELMVMPDACVNLLFNQMEPEIAGVTAINTQFISLNLGRNFDYVGVQLYPGSWAGDLSDTLDHFVGSLYQGDLPLIDISKAMFGLDFVEKIPFLAKIVEQLIDMKLISKDPKIRTILDHIDEIDQVSDMAEICGLSARQLQRHIKQRCGFTPHNFLKVMRLQKSFKQHYLDYYADQSHYIHDFKRITGHTPKSYFEKFDV